MSIFHSSNLNLTILPIRTYYERGTVAVILSHNVVSPFPPGLDKYQFFSPLSYICSSLLGAPFLHQETEIP